MTRTEIRDLILLLATKPRLGMRAALNLGLGSRALVLLAALVSVLTGIMGFLVTMIAPVAEGMTAPTPIGYAIVAGSNILLSTVLFFWAGKIVKGTGTIQNVALALILHQGFMMLLPLILAFVSVINPALSGIMLLVGLPYLLYLMAGFLAEAHQLRSMGTAIFLIVGAIIGLSFILLFFISLFAIAPV